MGDAGVLDRLSPGDHACFLYDDDTTRVRALTTYLRAGLRDHHRVIYYGDNPEQLRADLTASGLDPAVVLRRRQLQLVSPESFYLASGAFDPEAAISGWKQAVEQARADGYRGLRAAGDMSWASRAVPGADRLPWYEEQVNRVFAGGYAMAVCLYDRRLFDDGELRRFCWAHPAGITAATDPATVPALRAVRTTRPPGIRLTGEADLSNHRALRTVVEHLAEDTAAAGAPLTIDVSGLRFADGAALRILVQLAGRAHRLRVVGCSTGMRRMLSRTGADAVPGLTVEPLA